MHTTLPRIDETNTAPLPLQPKLIPRLREALRLRRYSLKTERNYVHWIVILAALLSPSPSAESSLSNNTSPYHGD